MTLKQGTGEVHKTDRSQKGWQASILYKENNSIQVSDSHLCLSFRTLMLKMMKTLSYVR